MRMHRLFSSLVLSFVIFCVLFSTSAYAATIEQYSYNGVVLPKLPQSDREYANIYVKNNTYYLMFTYSPFKYKDLSGISISGMGTSLYKVEDNTWVEYTPISITDCTLIWTNYDVITSEGALTLKGTDPIVTMIDLPVSSSDIDPFISAFGDQINVPLVIGVLAGLAGVSVVLVFMWWGVRKVSGSLMKAFKKGKIRI